METPRGPTAMTTADSCPSPWGPNWTPSIQQQLEPALLESHEVDGSRLASWSPFTHLLACLEAFPLPALLFFSSRSCIFSHTICLSTVKEELLDQECMLCGKLGMSCFCHSSRGKISSRSTGNRAMRGPRSLVAAALCLKCVANSRACSVPENTAVFFPVVSPLAVLAWTQRLRAMAFQGATREQHPLGISAPYPPCCEGSLVIHTVPVLSTTSIGTARTSSHVI